jgi:hypothetical protein
MASPPRCGTCELLERSGTPGLHTYGKCPHRHAWVRTQDAACEHHVTDRPKLLVRVAMILNGAAVTLSLGAFIVLDVRHGTLLSHAVLGGVIAAGLVFLWLVRRYGLFSEEPKYDVLEQADPPPEEDEHRWWLDP